MNNQPHVLTTKEDYARWNGLPPIAYPVKVVYGASHQLEDAAGRVIGSEEAAGLINDNQPT